MARIIYKKATKKNFQALYDLSVMFEHYNQKTSRNNKDFFNGNWQKYFKDEILEGLEYKKAINLIAWDKKTPVGYIYAYYCEKCFYYLISEFFVLEKYRGKGIGKKLFKLALTWGKKYKSPVRVEVFNWNKSAIEFYLKCGFKNTTVALERKH